VRAHLLEPFIVRTVLVFDNRLGKDELWEQLGMRRIDDQMCASLKKLCDDRIHLCDMM
jgi:hypothetical protein